MTDPHPVIPPTPLLKKWEDQWFDESQNVDVLLIEAFQAGADQELEACCEWLQDPELNVDTYKLRAARRPKPPTLKKQALSEVAAAVAGGNITPERGATIRLALEALPND